MRCLDSDSVPAVLRADGRARCGGCGRLLRTVVRADDPARAARLPAHGDRRRCPVCRSTDPLHHISDHHPRDGWDAEMRTYDNSNRR